MPTATAPDTVDGRRVRRDRNRDAVVDALLTLYGEGNREPGSAEIAERARSALAAIDVLTSYESYQLLRNDQALSRAEASTILVNSLTTLLAAPSPTDPEVDR